MTVSVTDGQLVCSGDGQAVSLPRHRRDTDRIIITGRAGYISIPALRWCQVAGVSIVVVDRTGELLLATASSAGGSGVYAHLHRRQAEPRLDIVKWLITEKLMGQCRTLEALGYTPNVYSLTVGEVEKATTVERIRGLEGTSGSVYWRTIGKLPVEGPWKFQEHWRVFGPRKAGVKMRKAAGASTPAQALVNYAYGILAGEALVAVHAAGLDPAMGILHREVNAGTVGRMQGRPNLALDVMEPCRPLVDSEVVKWVVEHQWKRSDAAELETGEVLVSRALRKEVAALVQPVARKSTLKVTRELVRLLR